MTRDLRTLSNRVYDIVIIGGGINGAALANLASSRRLKALLLEKNDFASGTSSKSTKLVHGGIRYLENFEFGLVHEALHERYIQAHIASHLVKPLPFLIPVYKNDPRSLFKMKIGVWLYDFLSGKYRLGRHQSFNAEKTLQMEPRLRPQDLLGSVLYYDAQMDDARLCLENVLSARNHGAHVLNYAQVGGFIKENGRAVGVKGRDVLTGQTFDVRAKKIVSCAGPWNDEILLKDNLRATQKVRTTKGVHLVYKGALTKHAILIQSRNDRRIFFIIPWHGHSLIGTTDTDYTGNIDNVDVKDEDIQYLFDESRRIFPTVDFKRENLINTFAGLRPLVAEPGDPSKVSRRHVIAESFSGVFYVRGGKYTTYRAIALDCLKKVYKGAVPLEKIPFAIYGSGEIKTDLHAVSREFDIDPEIVLSLRQKYGVRYVDVLKLTQKDKTLKDRICTCSNTIKAQIIYSRDIELALTPEDVIERRLGLQYLECETKQCRRIIEEIMKQ